MCEVIVCYVWVCEVIVCEVCVCVKLLYVKLLYVTFGYVEAAAAGGGEGGEGEGRLPRKTTVDVRLCHACHVKRRWMSGSGTPATQKWHGAPARNPGPRANQYHKVAHLPRKIVL